MDYIKLNKSKLTNMIDNYDNNNANAVLTPGMAEYASFEYLGKKLAETMLSPECLEAYKEGYIYLHDLAQYPFKGLNCITIDPRHVLGKGINCYGDNNIGVVGGPAKHLDTALHHLGQAMGLSSVYQSGGVALASLNTFIAPYCVDVPDDEVKQVIQSFVYSMNEAFKNRGSQSLFSSVNFDLAMPDFLLEMDAVGPGGKYNGKYGDYEDEAIRFVKLWNEVVIKGDHYGKPIFFPNTIYNIDDVDLDNWDDIFEYSAKYSLPYFSSSKNSKVEYASKMGSISNDTKLLTRIGGEISLEEAGSVLTTGYNIIEVMTFDEDMNFEWNKIEVIIEKPPAPLYEITTKQGRIFKVTPNHKIPVIKSNEIVEVLSENLSIGDKLINYTENKYVSEIDPLYYFIGIFIADGYIKRNIHGQYNSNQIDFHIKKEWKREEIFKLCDAMELKYNLRDNHIIIDIDTWMQSLLLECYHGKDKIIPYKYFNDKHALYSIKYGLEFDAYKSSNGRFQLYTSSEKLANQFMLILDMLGVIHSHRSTQRYNWAREFNVSYNFTWIPENVITSIQLIENDEPVYDLQIENNHNYVCGEGLNAIYNCRTSLPANWTGDPNQDCMSTGNAVYTTLNLPMIALESNSRLDFFNKLIKYCDIIHDYTIERFNHIKYIWSKDIASFYTQEFEGKPFYNLDNATLVIGFVGLSETVEILTGSSIVNNVDIGIDILRHLNYIIDTYKKVDELRWGVFATPAESAAGKLAMKCVQKYGFKKSHAKGTHDAPYYTNSSHVPVDADIDIIQRIKIESELQQYTGAGNIMNIYLGEAYSTASSLKSLCKKIHEHGKVFFWSFTGEYSICDTCNTTFKGNRDKCLMDGEETTVFSRVTGYMTATKTWNKSKKAEFRDRKRY
jgi:anaerobic ribonucleoside-triphosphate reductase